MKTIKVDRKPIKGVGMQLLNQFLQEEEGTTAIEYALIGVLVSIAIIGGATATGTSITRFYDFVVEQLELVL